MNRHFGNPGDVFKHLLLCEVLEDVRPARYAESHAGSPTYPLVPGGDRDYGIGRLLDVLPALPVLASSAYAGVLAGYVPATYPGSAAQAMTLLGDDTDYLLCDLDPASAQELRAHAAGLGLQRCTVAEQDGMATVDRWLDSTTLVHVDPFDPHASGESGLSAIDLAGRVASSGAGLVYWYGFSSPTDRGWPLEEIGSRTSAPLTMLDVLVTDEHGNGVDGDLGVATTAATGFGLVLAHLPAHVVESCARLARALASGYDGVPLADGTVGRWDLAVRT